MWTLAQLFYADRIVREGRGVKRIKRKRLQWYWRVCKKKSISRWIPPGHSPSLGPRRACCTTNQSRTNIRLLKTICLAHRRAEGLQEVKNMFNWSKLNMVSGARTKHTHAKIHMIYTDIMNVLNSSLSSTPLTNDLATNIGQNEILSEVQGRISKMTKPSLNLIHASSLD